MGREAPHILFAGGGTLGPVTPLLAVAQYLKDRGARFSWVGTSGGPEKGIVEGQGIAFHAIRSGKLRRYLSWRNLSDPFLVLAGTCDAWRLLGRLRPDVVVSAGGFVAVPAVWAAWLRRIPVHVHQQDYRPGLANRLSAPFAASISVAFEKSLVDFDQAKTVWTGNPVRPAVRRGERDRAIHRFGLDPSRPTVLVLGGGGGSASLNDLLKASLDTVGGVAQVIHLTGRGKEAAAAAPGYHAFELLGEEIADAYEAADLVVSRAGMGTLSEIAALGKPALIIPLPGTHQEENARHFADQGGVAYLDESGLTPQEFGQAVRRLIRDRDRLRTLADTVSRVMKQEAERRVAEMILAAARPD